MKFLENNVMKLIFLFFITFLGSENYLKQKSLKDFLEKFKEIQQKLNVKNFKNLIDILNLKNFEEIRKLELENENLFRKNVFTLILNKKTEIDDLIKNYQEQNQIQKEQIQKIKDLLNNINNEQLSVLEIEKEEKNSKIYLKNHFEELEKLKNQKEKYNKKFQEISKIKEFYLSILKEQNNILKKPPVIEEKKEINKENFWNIFAKNIKQLIILLRMQEEIYQSYFPKRTIDGFCFILRKILFEIEKISQTKNDTKYFLSFEKFKLEEEIEGKFIIGYSNETIKVTKKCQKDLSLTFEKEINRVFNEKNKIKSIKITVGEYCEFRGKVKEQIINYDEDGNEIEQIEKNEGYFDLALLFGIPGISFYSFGKQK